MVSFVLPFIIWIEEISNIRSNKCFWVFFFFELYFWVYSSALFSVRLQFPRNLHLLLSSFVDFVSDKYFFSFLSDVLFDQVSEGVLISGTIIQIPSHVHPQKHRREVRLLRESEEHRVWTSPDSGQELCRKNNACSWWLLTSKPNRYT